MTYIVPFGFVCLKLQCNTMSVQVKQFSHTSCMALTTEADSTIFDYILILVVWSLCKQIVLFFFLSSNTKQNILMF
jgi:hypothetical protein